MKTKKETLTFRQVVILILICFIAILRTQTAGAQQIAKDSTGNYITLSKAKEPAKDTGKTLTLADGTKTAIFETANKKYYVLRTSKKSGKIYKMYLKL